jgi:type IV secretory pathway VirB2 component (pilin)
MQFFKTTYFTVLALVLVLPSALYAQGRTGDGDRDIGRTGDGGVPNSGGSFMERNLFDLFFSLIDNVLLPIAAVVAVIALIYSGFMFVSALGKPDKLSTAKRNFVFVLIGTVLLLGASTLGRVVQDTICDITNIQVLCGGGSADGGVSGPAPERTPAGGPSIPEPF